MTVSFTGIKNIGCTQTKDIFGGYTDYINFQLTNDKNGDDLSNFHVVLSKVKDGAAYQHYTERGIISLAVNKMTSKSAGRRYYFELNGHEIEQNDENLPLFEFLAKKIKKISEMNESEYTIDEGYTESNDFNGVTYVGVVSNCVLPKSTGKSQNELIEEAHQPKVIKENTKRINETIKDAMMDYYA